MDNYRYIGPVYDFLCQFYAGKAINQCRNSMLGDIKPGMKILFAGVGHGADAIYASQSGADVTVVELSQTMMRKFRENCEKSVVQDRIRMIEGDIFEHDSSHSQYDIVVANFFLNIFDVNIMKQALNHLVGQAKPGSKLIIGDFIFPSQNNFLSRIFIKSYWFLANTLFYFLAKNPIHKIYDYPKYLNDLGLIKQDIKYTKFLNIKCFWSIQAIKPLTV